MTINTHTSSAKRRFVRRLIIALIATVTAVAILVTAVFILLPKYRYNPISDTLSELGVEEVFDQKIMNIALFGVDARDMDSFSGLSDSIMVLSINTETKQIKLLSIMRDSLVKVERNGKVIVDKINAVYQLEGPALSIKTLNQNFGLDISEYVTVNFNGLAHIIDAVGGVDITLTDTEVRGYAEGDYPAFNDYIDELCSVLSENPKEHYIRKAGTYHVNGIQAVAYSRIRFMPNVWGGRDDYGRTDRQRYVMEQLFQKALAMSKTDYIKLAKALFPYVETSLSYSESINLATGVLLKSPTFQQMRIPRYEFVMPSPAGAWGSAVYYDLDYAARVMKAVIYEDMTIDDYEALYPVEKYDWYSAWKSQQ